MFEITAVAGWAAGILALASFVPYILAILRGETTPNRATWLIWTVVGIMLGSSYHASGADHTIWLAISYVAGPFTVFILSLKHGEAGWTKLDRSCLLTAGASAFLWWLSGSALFALCMNLVADAMGALPTILKAYHRPESENRLGWTIGFIAAAVNLRAVEDWGSFSIAAYPVYMFLCTGAIAALLWSRPRKELNLA